MKRNPIRAALLFGLCATGGAQAADTFFVERAFDPAIVVETAKADAAPGQIALQIMLDGSAHRIVLEPNDALERSVAPHVPAVGSNAQRLYRGHIDGLSGSWARLSLFEGQWQGSLWDGREMWSLAAARELPGAAATAGVASGSIVYRGSDAWDRLDLGDDVRRGHATITPMQGSQAAKRGTPYNLGLSIVLDTEFQTFHTNEASRVAAIINIVDGYYADANTNVYLNALQLLGPGNTMTSSDTGTLLEQLRVYQGTPAAPPFHAATHLLSGKAGVGGGLAYLGTLCNPGYGIGVNGGRNDPATTAAILAHELGHNYGSEHDGEAGTHGASCPSDGFVMEPVITIGNPADSFSTCSLTRFAQNAPGFACLLTGGGGSDPIFSDGFEN